MKMNERIQTSQFQILFDSRAVYGYLIWVQMVMLSSVIYDLFAISLTPSLCFFLLCVYFVKVNAIVIKTGCALIEL